MLTFRKKFLIPLLSGASILVGAACSGTGGGGPEDGAEDGDSGSRDDAPRPDASNDDASSDGDADASDGDADSDGDGDADASDGEAGGPTTRFVDGDVALYGVTTGNQAIYARVVDPATHSLEALDLATGVKTVISATLSANASVVVKGNAVGVWTDIAQNGLGTFNYWTPVRAYITNVSTSSMRDMFWASEDGKKLAAFQNAATVNDMPTTTDLAVIATADDARTTVLTGRDRVAFASQSCGSQIGFADKTLIVAYCRAGELEARLVTVRNSDTPIPRVLVGGGLNPFFAADATGSKILVTSPGRHEATLVLNHGPMPAPLFPLDMDVQNGFILQDGSALVMLSGTSLIRRTISLNGASKPTTIVDDPVSGILDVSADQERILFHSLRGVPVDPMDPDGDRYVDLRMATTSANGGPAVAIVPEEKALSLGMTGSAAFALYFANGPKLNAVATDGSGEEYSMPVQFTAMETVPWRSAVVVSKNARPAGSKTVVDLVHVDFTPANAPVSTTLAESVVSSALRFSRGAMKKLVYVRSAAQAPGLYVIDVP